MRYCRGRNAICSPNFTAMRKCALLARQASPSSHGRYSSTSAKQTPAEYCLNLVRKNDYENFLCTLLLAKKFRSAAFAVRAFNVEVALVEDQVRDNAIGTARLKFWEQTLNGIYENKPPKTPVALELHRILRKHKLSKYHFKRLAEARLEKLRTAMFPELDAVESYSEKTVSSVYYLLLEAAGRRDVHADHVASHLGKAQGIATLLRSVPHNARRRSVVLPRDLLVKHGASTEAIFRCQSGAELRDVVFEVSSRAKQHLDLALRMKADVAGKECDAIFLPHVVIDVYLEKLRRADFDVFHPDLQKRDHLLPARLLWRKLVS